MSTVVWIHRVKEGCESCSWSAKMQCRAPCLLWCDLLPLSFICSAQFTTALSSLLVAGNDYTTNTTEGNVITNFHKTKNSALEWQTCSLSYSALPSLHLPPTTYCLEVCIEGTVLKTLSLLTSALLSNFSPHDPAYCIWLSFTL